MPIINGIYTKDFPDLGRAVLSTDIVIIAIAGDPITYKTTTEALRTFLGKTVTGTSDSSGNYNASGDGLPAFPIYSVYEGANMVPASYNNTTKIISGLNTLTAFTAKFL